MAESVVEKQENFVVKRRLLLTGLVVGAFIVYNALNGEGDAIREITDSDDSGLRRRLAQATAENNALEKQNADLKKQIADFDKKYQAQQEQLEDVRKELKELREERTSMRDERTRGRYDDRRPYWDRPVRGPSYSDSYGRPPFHPAEYRWYGAGSGPAYPIEYGRPSYGSPYRYPWWDDRIYQRPFGYNPNPYGYGPQQYGHGPYGGRSIRLGFDSRGGFNFGYQGNRFGIRFGGRF